MFRSAFKEKEQRDTLKKVAYTITLPTHGKILHDVFYRRMSAQVLTPTKGTPLRGSSRNISSCVLEKSSAELDKESDGYKKVEVSCTYNN